MVSILNCMVMQIHIANWCTWLAHTLCKGLIWNYKKIVEHSLDFHLGYCKRFDEVENVSGILFLTDTGFCSEILKYALLYIYISLFSFGWWHTLMKNKHQISLHLGLKKWPTFCRWNCQMDFPLKKILSVYLSVCQSICPSISLSVRLSVSLSVCLCLSHLFHYALIMVSSWNFQEWLPMIEVIDVYAKVQGQKSKFKVTEVKTQISRFGTITPVWLHMVMKWCTKLDIV